MYLIYENKVDVSRDKLTQGALTEWPEKEHLSCSGLFLNVKVALSFDLPLWLCLFSFAFLRLFHFCSLMLSSISPSTIILYSIDIIGTSIGLYIPTLSWRPRYNILNS